MDRGKATGVETILEQLIEHGAGDMANIFAGAFDLAMGPPRALSRGPGMTSARPAAKAMPTAPSPSVSTRPVNGKRTVDMV